jgi:hypothetical protein
MKVSEFIKHSNGCINPDKLGEVLDQMAEDIKWLKNNIDHPFPFLLIQPKEREWEKDIYGKSI